MSVPDSALSSVTDRTEIDRKYMAEALVLARSTATRTWPNPPVGAVVVKDGKIVGRGAHPGPGLPHAEPIALNEAGEAARGATLYVTLEPCTHQGRTAPCAPHVAESGVARVVVAMRDPNPQVAGGGCRYLRDRGIEVTLGIRADEALDMVWPFVVTEGFKRPYVELKTAVSLDGKFAPLLKDRKNTSPVYLTGSKSRHDVHRRRRWVDVVVVGEGTAQAESPRLDGRLARSDDDVPAQDPQAAYVDSDLSWTGGLDRESYLVFTGEKARGADNRTRIEDAGGRVVFCADGPHGVDPASLLTEAQSLGLHALMIEGGPNLAASFLEAGLVDRWIAYLAPVVMGRGIGWPADRSGPALPCCDFRLTRTGRFGQDLMAIHDLRSFDQVLAEVII